MIRLAGPGDLETVARISAEAYAIYEPIIGALPMPATENYGRPIRNMPTTITRRS